MAGHWFDSGPLDPPFVGTPTYGARPHVPNGPAADGTGLFCPSFAPGRGTPAQGPASARIRAAHIRKTVTGFIFHERSGP